MYTLAAVLGMGLLGAVVSLLYASPERPPAWSRLAVYMLCGTLGLWTLYYFGFLLVAVNLMVGLWWFLGWRQGRVGWAWLGRWLLAQGVVLLLYTPWIPVAWRQATQPPVPPWRGFTVLGELIVETWTALSLGQSAAPEKVWPLLILFAVLVGLGLIYKASVPVWPRWLLAGYVLLPVILIYLASFVTPLYHVRYAFTYSTPFYILAGAGLAWLSLRWRPALWLGLVLIFAFSGISILAYHTDPHFASDDHRAATQFLARRWHPGDAILVNAGYAYAALLTYWNGEPIVWQGRLVNGSGPAAGGGPVVVQSGTIDGDPSLGWGDPQSDFYAMSQAEAGEALARLFADFDRVWVYRIYDTVTDADGFIRDWLRDHGRLFEDRVFTGEGQLRVQGFLTGRDPLQEEVQPLDAGLADGTLQALAATPWQSSVKVGEALDLALVWRVREPLAEDLILFAGLFDGQGQRWAQTDEQPLGALYPPAEWPVGAEIRTPLAVVVPPGTPPGRYRLEVGWYRFVEGQPVWLPWASGERLALGEIEVVAPDDWAAVPLPDMAQSIGVTIGEGVRLLGMDAPSLAGYPGDTLELDLFWQALEERPGIAVVVLQLTDDAGNLLAEVESAPVGGRVPLSALVARQTIRDRRALVLPGGLEPGIYNVSVGRRRPEGGWLPVRRGPFPLGSTYPLATVHVMGRPLVLTPPAVAQRVDARFGEAVRCVGYDLVPQTSRLDLCVYWQALAPMTTSYKVFVHLVGAGGAADILAQADLFPQPPTVGWVPGEYLDDCVALDLPADLSAGGYSLLIGLYDERSGDRLPVFDATGELLGDSLLLAQIHLGE